MDKQFQSYTLEDFLNDSDFCRWALEKDKELEAHYARLLEQFPEENATFQKARQIVRLFNDEQVDTDPARKLQIWKEINRTAGKEQKKASNRLFFKYAAALIALLMATSVSVYVINSYRHDDFMTSFQLKAVDNTKLVLDNGKEIDISEEQSSVVYNAVGNQIQVNKDTLKKATDKEVIQENHLIVPFGKRSKIVLPDQTEIWLNAGSHLVYPSKFDDRIRKVKLIGEGLFKVHKNPDRPFIVETANSAIKVLGTTFNVKAYPDEGLEETVLVEGSVSLNLGKSLFKRNVLLKPNQKISLNNADDSYGIEQVNVDDYTSWIQGLFSFKNEPLQLVFGRVSRYYNIDIAFNESTKNKKITGKLDLKEDCQRVLDALALIADGSYTENDGKIIFKITPKNEK